MSDVIEAYTEELTSVFNDLQKRIDSKSSDINGMNVLLDQLSDLLKQYSVEVRSLDEPQKGDESAKMATYKKKLDKAKMDVKILKTASERKDLLGDGDAASLDKRQRYADANAKLERQNEMILNAQRTVEETQEVGADISESLAANREKIQSTHDKVKELHGDLDSADRITKSMVDRAKCVIS